jgi:hypothetical protein
MLLLYGTVMLLIPSTITSPSLVFGQGVLEQFAGTGAFPTSFPPSLGAPLSTLPPSASIMPTPTQAFPPSASLMPGPTPAINGLNGLSFGTAFPESMNAIPTSSLLPPESPLSSQIPFAESASSTPVTIYACMDLASGNIPVNSIGMPSATGCPPQTAPIVIMMDDSTNTVSTCFVAADMITPTSNCISVNSPLQQQQQLVNPALQQQQQLQLTAPFSLPFQ